MRLCSLFWFHQNFNVWFGVKLFTENSREFNFNSFLIGFITENACFKRTDIILSKFS